MTNITTPNFPTLKTSAKLAELKALCRMHESLTVQGVFSQYADPTEFEMIEALKYVKSLSNDINVQSGELLAECDLAMIDENADRLLS